MSLVIDQIPCLSDNYGYLVHEPLSGQTATIDTPEMEPIMDRLTARGWTLTHIFNTHHHFDHTGANLDLKAATGCEIIGPAGEQQRIPGIDRAVDQGDTLMLGDVAFDILNVGGHTLGHIAYVSRSTGHAFVGDTLFAMGCGRVFEGTMTQMWESLQKLAALPPETQVYCAHEYTEANARFAATIDPDNQALMTRIEEITALRAADKPTVPTTIGLELATNPFLRAADPGIRALLGMEAANDDAVFAEIRARKDKA